MLTDRPTPAAQFKIKIVGRLITVVLRGQWTIQTDLAYLSELGEAMQQMRGNKWAVLVDMRGWVVPKNVSESPLRPKLTLDRRNQKFEYWIVESSEQGEDLLENFIQSGLIPQRFIDPLAAYQALLNGGYIANGTNLAELIGHTELTESDAGAKINE